MNCKSLLFFAACALAPVAAAADLHLEVTNITEPGGTVNWSLFDAPGPYKENRNPVMTARNRVVGSSSTSRDSDIRPPWTS